MKRIVSLFIMIVMLICSFSLVGCANKVDATDENSHIISIYEEKYRQDEDGTVVFEGYKLKESTRVVKTQMYEIKKVDIIEIDGEKQFGKYYYSGDFRLSSNVAIVENKKIQFFPSANMKILFREREKKNINVYYDNFDIKNRLSYDERNEYEKMFENTYEEHFIISGSVLTEVLKISNKSYNGNIEVEAYTNENFTGVPFATQTFTRSYDYVAGERVNKYTGQMSLHLIQTTNVYLKISLSNE